MADVKRIAENRKARFQYAFGETFTAGIVLVGTEVKALREGRIRMDGSYARIIDNQAYVYNLYIGEYSHASHESHETERRRRLLLHKREILKLTNLLRERGTTLVPTKMFFNTRNLAKIEIAVARGKSRTDKRETIKKREASRDIRNTMLKSKRSRRR